MTCGWETLKKGYAKVTPSYTSINGAMHVRNNRKGTQKENRHKTQVTDIVIGISKMVMGMVGRKVAGL